MDDEVVIRSDALDMAEPTAGFDTQPGLLAHLPGDGVDHALAPLHPTARDAPQPDPGAAAPAHEQDLAIVDDDGTDAYLGAGPAITGPARGRR